MESEHIVRWRRDFIRKIRKFRSEHPQNDIVYLDETWAHCNMVKEKMWADDQFDLNLPIGGGGRYIIVHAGSRRGFISNAAKCYRTTQVDGDYHRSMNSQVFEDWFTRQLLPNLSPNSLIVLDNAAYHSRLVEKRPSSSSKKIDIIEYLMKLNIEPDSSLIKPELLQLAKNNAPPKKYFVDELAAANGHSICRLPPYHCDLNPIELIWAQLKTSIRKNNITFKMRNLEALILQAIEAIDQDHWLKACQHVDEIKNKYWCSDNTIDDIFDESLEQITEVNPSSEIESNDESDIEN